MLCILSPNTDPYFNLASEEYLLKCFSEDIFLLYRNTPTIVVGKHQNTLAEINLPFVQEQKIKIARRISGGGAVYHDLGNLNFAFFTNGREGELVDYKKATLPVVGALGKMGLDVKLGKRNELLLHDLKISGTASHVFKNRVLHHGTLLFSSEMGLLGAALKTEQERFTDRAVKSIRSRVTNISKYLSEQMTLEIFQERILNHVLYLHDDNRIYSFSDFDMKEITSRVQSKFSTWEWNFGYSPRYRFVKSISTGAGRIDLQMNVERGVIREFKIEGDFFSLMDISALEKMITGTIHDPETLRRRLSGINLSDYIPGLENETLLSGMF
jgi:lipoate-protein ligase A